MLGLFATVAASSWALRALGRASTPSVLVAGALTIAISVIASTVLRAVVCAQDDVAPLAVVARRAAPLMAFVSALAAFELILPVVLGLGVWIVRSGADRSPASDGIAVLSAWGAGWGISWLASRAYVGVATAEILSGRGVAAACRRSAALLRGHRVASVAARSPAVALAIVGATVTFAVSRQGWVVLVPAVGWPAVVLVDAAIERTWHARLSPALDAARMAAVF